MERQITVELKRSERELLLNILDIDPGVEKKLASPAVKGNLLAITLTEDELSGILAGLAAEAEGTDDPNLRRAFEELQERLEKIQGEGAP